MRPLDIDDVRPPAAYEPVRAEARRQVIELKRHRRVHVGELISLVFENRETVCSVVEELLRAERIEEQERIAEEVRVFNGLIPGDAELSATMFLEVVDQAEMTVRLGELRGIEETVSLSVSGTPTACVNEPGRSRDDRTSSVHYLRFRLSAAQRDAFAGGAEVVVSVDHPAYRARAVLTDEQRSALAADLGGA